MNKKDKFLSRYLYFLVYRLIGAIFHEDKRIAERLPNYFPTYRSFIGEFLNQFLRRIGSPKSFLPQGIIIEPTNYCNLRCKHCTAQAVDEDRGYMEYEFYTNIIDTNPQITCIILARNGEPFLHPKIFDMIAYAKAKGIYVSIYTNGILISKEKVDKILSVGLNEINFSIEGIGDVYRKNREVSYAVLKKNIECLIEKRKEHGVSLKIGINIAVIESDNYSVRDIKNEWEGKVDHIDIEPLMGEKSVLRTRSCRTLWRNLVVRWDGVVLPCCIDMRSSLIMGDLKKNSVREIFNGDRALALRKSHINGMYPPVCKYCDELFG